jgi:hypothetical protein
MDVEFWAVFQTGLQRKKDPNCHKFATFEVNLFDVFMAKKKN